MLRVFYRITLLLAALAVFVGVARPASADRAKLDPRARVALAQIEGGESAASMKLRGAAVNGASSLDVFIVGDVSRAELEAAGAQVRSEVPGAGIFTAYLPASAIDAVAALGGVTRIQGSAPCEPELSSSVPSTGATLLRGAGPAFTGYNGAGVILGDVDSGVDYGHGDFKDAGGLTRFINIWDQTTADALPPGAYGYGSEWDAASINANVCTEVDLSGHGTHVMGIQGGDGSQTGGAVPAFTYVGMAPMADLIMVKTTFQTTDILDGVNYIFDRATALGKNAACNISLGSHFGPHDGTDAFEAGLSALTGPGRLIAKSAGNERTNAIHAEIFAAGLGTNSTLSVTGGGAAGNVFAIDGYYEATENLAVQVTTPGGFVIGPIPLGGSTAAFPGVATPTNGSVYIENGVTLTATGDPEVYIEVNNLTGAPQTLTGTWTIRYIPVLLGAALGEVDMWRFFTNTSTANFVTGLQNGEEKISQPGNAVQLITTASYVVKRDWQDCNFLNLAFGGTPANNSLSNFTSPGPTRDGRQKPDIAAPGQAIGSTTSFDIAQVCAAGGSTNLPDGLNHTMNQGTSMAAPHVTGALALIMQKYGAVTPAFAKTFLFARAKVDANTGAVWNKDWGNGKLFLGDMIDPTCVVTAPNGGELYTVGQNVNLTWTASDALGGVTGVDLYLSRTGVGGPYSLIAANQPNTGSYAWIATGPATNNAILRVVAKDAALNTGKDESDADWRIEDAVPVSLMYFEAEANDGGGAVTLRWQFEDDSEYRVLDLERSDMRDGPYAGVAAERSMIAGQQIAIDRTALAGHSYFYRLAATLADNSKTYFGPVMATVDGATLAFGLSRPAPNPATGPVGVDFSLARDAKVRVTVVNVAGRVIAKLADGDFTAGVHHVSWDRAASGVPAGLYFVVYHTPQQRFSERVVVTN